MDFLLEQSLYIDNLEAEASVYLCHGKFNFSVIYHFAMFSMVLVSHRYRMAAIAPGIAFVLISRKRKSK